MARVTVEDCLAKVENRFVLIHLAAERARQLKKGAAPMSSRQNKEVVLALREIAAGQITHENVKSFDPPPMELEEIFEVIDEDNTAGEE